jgi:hypothetical protein
MFQTLACLVLAALAAEPLAGLQAPFQEWGYYITFMRMPTYDLDDWKRIVDGIHDDGGNLLLLWMGGAFRSQNFPMTWKYNEEHQNVRHDFVRDLIDHAHTKGVRILLGFTPFGYDGVNQYPLEHPEVKATGKDGKPVGKFGNGCWGYNLCPAKPESHQFMVGGAQIFGDGNVAGVSDSLSHNPAAGAAPPLATPPPRKQYRTPPPSLLRAAARVLFWFGENEKGAARTRLSAARPRQNFALSESCLSKNKSRPIPNRWRLACPRDTGKAAPIATAPGSLTCMTAGHAPFA